MAKVNQYGKVSFGEMWSKHVGGSDDDKSGFNAIEKGKRSGRASPLYISFAFTSLERLNPLLLIPYKKVLLLLTQAFLWFVYAYRKKSLMVLLV